MTLNKAGYLTGLKDPAGKFITAKYSAKGLLTTFTNARGMATSFGYDSAGLLLRDTSPAGGKQTLARSDDGNTVTRITAMGRVTTYATVESAGDDLDRNVTAPTGLTKTMHESADLATTVSTPDGVQIAVTPATDPRFGDSASIPQTTVTTTPGGLVNNVDAARLVVLENADPFSLTEQTETVALNGKSFTQIFDAASKTFTETTPAGRHSTSVIDSQGRMVSEQLAGLDQVDYHYDVHGRLDSVSTGSGGLQRTTQFTHDPQGHLQTIADPLGRIQSYVRDKVGRIVKQTLPGSTVKYAYDATGNLVKLTNPANKFYSFGYSKTDLLSAFSLPAATAKGIPPKQTYAYNLDNQLTRMTRFDGSKLAYSYDTGGRLNKLASVTNASLFWTYGYDATHGYLNTITAPGSVGLGFIRDGPVLQALSWTGPISGQVTLTHNSDFQTQAVKVNGGNAIAYGYDADGLLSTVGALTLLRSSQNGLRSGSTLGDIQDAYTYNTFGEVAHLRSHLHNCRCFNVGGLRLRQARTDHPAHGKLGRRACKGLRLYLRFSRAAAECDGRSKLHDVHVQQQWQSPVVEHHRCDDHQRERKIRYAGSLADLRHSQDRLYEKW